MTSAWLLSKVVIYGGNTIIQVNKEEYGHTHLHGVLCQSIFLITHYTGRRKCFRAIDYLIEFLLASKICGIKVVFYSSCIL